jgi:hypothetical protein
MKTPHPHVTLSRRYNIKFQLYKTCGTWITAASLKTTWTAETSSSLASTSVFNTQSAIEPCQSTLVGSTTATATTTTAKTTTVECYCNQQILIVDLTIQQINVLHLVHLFLAYCKTCRCCYGSLVSGVLCSWMESVHFD